MSETFENPREHRKAAQEILAETVHLSSALQKTLIEALWFSAGRSGMNTEQKRLQIDAMLERTQAAKEALNAFTPELLANLNGNVEQAIKHLEAALAMYDKQGESEATVKDADLMALLAPKTEE